MDHFSGDDAAFPQRRSARILHVASDASAADALRDALQKVGLSDLEVILDGRRALPAFRQLRPDVVLLDTAVEGLDALAIARQIGSRVGPDEFLPIVLLADPVRAMTLRARLDEVVSVFFRDAPDVAGIALLIRELAAVRGNGRLIADSLARRFASARRLEAEAAQHLAMFAELKDHPNSGHVFRVGELSANVARTLGFEPEEVDRIRVAAPLHDVGKIGIPDAILLKEEPLSLDELDVIKTHTSLGGSILAGSSSSLFQMAEEIALYHHENWDGTGYTPGLDGETIPMVGRIVRVVDSFDALTSTRHFAERWHHDHAVDFIREQAGQVFDPRVVEAFLDVVDRTEPADELARGVL